MSGFENTRIAIPKDRFMFDTVTEIAGEHGVADYEIISKVYEELYKETDEKRESWNCKMIDALFEKYLRGDE